MDHRPPRESRRYRAVGRPEPVTARFGHPVGRRLGRRKDEDEQHQERRPHRACHQLPCSGIAKPCLKVVFLLSWATTLSSPFALGTKLKVIAGSVLSEMSLSRWNTRAPL